MRDGRVTAFGVYWQLTARARLGAVRLSVGLMAVTALSGASPAAAQVSEVRVQAAPVARPASPCWAGDAGPWVVLYARGGRAYDITVTAVCRSDAKRQARRAAGRWIYIVDVFRI